MNIAQTQNNSSINPDFLNPYQVATLLGGVPIEIPKGYKITSPFRQDRNPSFNITLSDDGSKILFSDFGDTRSSKELFEAVCEKTGIKPSQLFKYGSSKSNGRVLELPTAKVNPFDTAYNPNKKLVGIYENLKGEEVKVYRVDKKKGKDFPCEPQGIKSPFQPYKHTEILFQKPLIIVEGEKCCDVLKAEGWNCTTFKGGCRAWNKTNWNFFKDFKQDVILWPDNDDVGIKAMDGIANELDKYGIGLFRVPIPQDKPEKWDCADCENEAERTALIDKIEPYPITPKVICITLDDIEDEPDYYLIQDWLPIECFTLLGGYQKTGKSTLSHTIAASLTKGAPILGDNEIQPCNVMIWSSEDTPKRIRRNIKSQGGILNKLYIPKIAFDSDGNPVKFDPAEHLNDLILEIKRNQIKCLILDPVISVSNNVRAGSEYTPQAIRKALKPLDVLIEETGIACIGIHHFRKSKGKREDGSIMDQFAGSGAWTQYARHILAVGKNENDKRVVMVAYSNLDKGEIGFEYEIKEKILEERTGTKKDPHLVGKYIQLGNFFEGNIDEILSVETPSENTNPSEHLAMDFVVEYLKQKEAYSWEKGMPLKFIQGEAKSELDLAKTPVRNACGILKKSGKAMTRPYKGIWVWWLLS